MIEALRAPTPEGIHRRNYSTNIGDKKLLNKPESEHIFNEVEAIIPAELWERCNADLDARHMKRERRPNKRRSPAQSRTTISYGLAGREY